jgi:hypothetical protein
MGDVLGAILSMRLAVPSFIVRLTGYHPSLPFSRSFWV